MKKLYIFLYLLIFCILISNSVFAGSEVTDTVTKVALKYQGESYYRIYDISNANMTHNSESNTDAYGPGAIVTLTDESNSLPSGVITEIKYYVIAGDSPSESGWLMSSSDLTSTPDDAFNFLGSNLDLSTIKRKRVTTSFYGGQGISSNEFVAATPSIENL
jgi:hypothetical protein